MKRSRNAGAHQKPEAPPTPREPPDAPELPSVVVQQPARAPRSSSGSPAAWRLSLTDVLVWVAGASVYLAILRTLAGGPVGATGVAIAGLQAILVGLAWGGVLLAPVRWARRSASITPGQWLLIALGSRLAVEILLHFRPQRLFSSPNTLVEAVTCWVLVLPLLNRRLVLRWRLAFIFLLLLYTTPLVLACLHLYGGVSPQQVTIVRVAVDWLQGVLVPVLLLGLLIWESRHAPANDWLHPAGIAAWAVAAVHWLIAQAG